MSPFLILLFGAAATGLAAEWLRFGWGLAPAAVPFLVGSTLTTLGVVRSYRARRAWRRRGRPDETEARLSAGEAGGAGGPPHPSDARPTDGVPTRLSLRRVEGGHAPTPAEAPPAGAGRAVDRADRDAPPGPDAPEEAPARIRTPAR